MDTKYPLYTPKDIFISFCGREATEAERWQGVQSGIISINERATNFGPFRLDGSSLYES